MKKISLTSTFILSLVSASVFAHHPAADRVDPETYAMIDENVADTPHADLTFDDMGADSDITPAMGAEEAMAAERDDVAMEMEAEMATITVLEDMDAVSID